MRRLEDVPLTEVDVKDNTFLITFMPHLGPLVASIQMVGLLEPLLLRERDDGRYQIICGFERVEALGHLSVAKAEAFVYSQSELDDHQALLLTIAHNILRPFNLVEKAQALERLVSVGADERKVIDLYLPLLGLQPNLRILKRVTSLLGLERGLQKYLVREGFSLSAAALFLQLDGEGQRAVLPMLETLRPGENRVKELITGMREISLRDGISIPSMVARKEMQEIIVDEDSLRPQRLERLRRVIKEMRYPRLTELERKFHAYKRSLSLPPQISLRPPAFFEGDQYRMELRFKDFRQLRHLIAKLNQIDENRGGPGDPLRDLGQ